MSASDGFRDAAIETHDGARIAYRIRPGRAPWVLVHGLGCDASMWDGVVAALPREVGVVLPELRGHGGSTLGWRTPSVDVWAEDVERVIAAEGIRSPVVGGLSMGGYVVLAFALTFPGRARAHALIDSSAAPDDEEGRLRRAQGLATLKERGWRAYLDGLVPSLLFETHERFPAHRGRLESMFERSGDSGLTAALFALASRPDRRSVLSFITVPTVAIVGEHDRLTPPERAAEIATGVRAGSLRVIPGAAHMSAMEAPEPVAAALLGVDG